jgi:hypothetical protein
MELFLGLLSSVKIRHLITDQAGAFVVDRRLNNVISALKAIKERNWSRDNMQIT